MTLKISFHRSTTGWWVGVYYKLVKKDRYLSSARGNLSGAVSFVQSKSWLISLFARSAALVEKSHQHHNPHVLC